MTNCLNSRHFLRPSIVVPLRLQKEQKFEGKIRKKQTKNIAIVDAVLFVRKQISRACGSIQVAADFIWEFYKWLYVIARIHVRYVTDIIVSQIAA